MTESDAPDVETIHTFGCGCTADEATGLPIGFCKRHDTRTSRVKVAAALAQMGNELDEAGRQHAMREGDNATALHLRDAAKYAVLASRAMLGKEEE